ncbi:MAG: hypothetical protein CBC42_04585 [Betaproteobacteria bacterium TMED82]|nr:MAG: hypothetical protein CBC42_04585 [Betaproteobacteria bacterium TMED82]|tara:strand:- start:6616 stop:7491 length:876 start_codon:yes stop_codon:yes gene_type:complete
MPNYRIASLLPSATELVSAIGLTDAIVCVSHECDSPAKIGHLPKVTSCNIPKNIDQLSVDQFVRESIRDGKALYDINVDLLIKLKVSHIITQGVCEVCAVSPDLIRTNLRGNKCILPSKTKIISLSGTTIQGIFEDVTTLSKAFNKIENGKSIIRLAENKLKVFGNTLPKNRTVLMLEWLDPPYIAGHWVPEQIEAAGFNCALGKRGNKSEIISWDEIVRIDPDFIGLIACGGNLTENQRYADILSNMENLKNLKSVRNKNVFAFDANKFFSRPTLGVIDGIEALQRQFLI